MFRIDITLIWFQIRLDLFETTYIELLIDHPSPLDTAYTTNIIFKRNQFTIKIAINTPNIQNVYREVLEVARSPHGNITLVRRVVTDRVA